MSRVLPREPSPDAADDAQAGSSAVRVLTLGCRLNAYESEVMRQHAQAAGLGETVLINTCAVTGEAVRQAAQAIRKARRESPGARIVVTGCAAQIEPARFAAMPEVDAVIGNGEKMQRATFVALATAGSARVLVNDIMSVRETAHAMVDGFGSRVRAYVQVQNGCDHRCTFCIIPYGRGPSRSVPSGEAVAQVRRLVEAGYPEVVLTGVDMTAYGKDLPGSMTLGLLVRQEPRLMPHLHLSLQAGDDMVLKRMKRRHSRADAIEFCATARQLRPDIVFGADLIGGFPTETEEMFANSLRLVDECGLTYLHVFPYSRRDETPAARMPQVAGPEIKERAARLRRKGDASLARYLEEQVGRDAEVLIEREGLGRTPGYANVILDKRAAPGELITARVTRSDGARLQARQLTPTSAP